jgi:hypothetical protein
MRRGVGWANQWVEVWVLLEVCHDKRADWNHDELVIPGKLKRRPREPRGNASMPEWRRHLSVVEYEATCPVIVIPEHRHAFWKAGLESMRHRVIRNRDCTSRFDILHGSQRSFFTLLHHVCVHAGRTLRGTPPTDSSTRCLNRAGSSAVIHCVSGLDQTQSTSKWNSFGSSAILPDRSVRAAGARPRALSQRRHTVEK